MHHHRNANGQLVDANGNVLGRLLDEDDDDLQLLQPAKKRLRLLTAGLSRKERSRIRNVPKQLTNSHSMGSNGASSLGWAGAGADMLEKKRKEEEKRRSIEEKQRAREAYTEIGSMDWKRTALQSQSQVTFTHDRLSLITQQEIARALAMPLCVESKELPDLESMRDLMTLHSVENGLLNGASAQAAALLLTSLQCHLQNVMASIITKIRANRQMGIRTTGIQRSAASTSAADEFQLVTDADSARSADDSFETVASDPNPTPNHLHVARNLLHDSSSISSSSISLGIGSGADSSMMSLASTAPTSIPAGSIASSEAASANEHVSSSNGSAAAKSAGADGEEEQADTSMSDGQETLQREKENRDPRNANTLELRHLSFLLDIAPHTIVESLGQGSQERLLAAEWTHSDEDAERRFESTPEGILQKQARLSSTAKLSAITPAAFASSGQIPSNGQSSTRNNFIIDQLAPIRLFDRRTLAESNATNSQQAIRAGGKKGGLRLPNSKPSAGKGPINSEDVGRTNNQAEANNNSSDENKVLDLASMIASRYGAQGNTAQPGNNSQAINNAIAAAAAASANHHRGQDPHLYDVVDPVALLASLVA
ncbi:hypothetical protein L7F22_042155 [Adiantum nelumboides]|nr:hypothetical protein [Adiantum nelumboides]